MRPYIIFENCSVAACGILYRRHASLRRRPELNSQNKKAGSRGGSPRKGGSGRESLPAGAKGQSPMNERQPAGRRKLAAGAEVGGRSPPLQYITILSYFCMRVIF